MTAKKRAVSRPVDGLVRKRYRLLREGELTDSRQGDEFNTNQGWVPTMRDGRHIHAGLAGAYRRPIANVRIEARR